MNDLLQRLRDRPNDAPMHAERLMDEAADRIEQLERVLAQARLHIAGEALPTKQEALAAIDEALHSEVSEKR